MMKKASEERAPHPIQQTVQNKGIGKHQGKIPGVVADSPPQSLFYELFRLKVNLFKNGEKVNGCFFWAQWNPPLNSRKTLCAL